MAPRDIFLSLDDQDAAVVETVIARLEMRAREPRFVQMRAAYLDSMDLAKVGRFLDLGCGTGVDARAAAQRPEFGGTAVGVDLSAALIDAGRRFAAEEGVADRVELRVGDAHATGLPDASFDAVVAHTLVSHVKDPLAVLREAARLVKPGGSVVIFDADFASLSFAHPDVALAEAMEKALLAAVVAQPRVMRDLPRLLKQSASRRWLSSSTSSPTSAPAATTSTSPRPTRPLSPALACCRRSRSMPGWRSSAAPWRRGVSSHRATTMLM